MDIIRAYIYQSSIYSVKTGGPRDFTLFDLELMGEFPKEYARADDFPFAQYGEKDGKIFWIYQPFGSHIDRDLAWLKTHPRPAHREVFPRGEIIDEESGKVIKVVTNVTLLDILEALKEFVPQRDR